MSIQSALNFDVHFTQTNFMLLTHSSIDEMDTIVLTCCNNQWFLDDVNDLDLNTTKLLLIISWNFLFCAIYNSPEQCT